jgi:hypothetical protein
VAPVIAKSDYQSGFLHGNKDVYDNCSHTDGCHFYIRQPGHEFKHLTEEFIRGYITGFCTVTHWERGGAFYHTEAGFDCRNGTSPAANLAAGGPGWGN